MIRLRTSPRFPKTLFTETVYGICSKNTILGVHRRMEDMKGVDVDCSKSMLILSNDKHIMEYIADNIERRQKWGITIDRNVDDDVKMLPTSFSSTANLSIEQFYFPDLEKLCCIHHFDMYIAFNLYEENGRMDVPSDIVLDGYEHTSHEWPQRSIVEKYMRDMLYRY